MKHGILVLLALVLGISTLAFSATDETSQKKNPNPKATAGQKANQKVTDPVCGMEIDTKKAAGKSTYKGKTYHSAPSAKRSSLKRIPRST